MLTLAIPRELKSPNRWNGCHWRVKHRESQEWEMEIAVSLLTKRAQRNVWAVLVAMNAVPPKRVCTERRRVTVTRQVPSVRNFIKDEDNLRFATKPLNDALKRLGLIKDDNRKWLEQPMPTQEVGPVWMTVIQIEAA